ncbi:MAG: hypothetical protein HKN73_18340, partial [Gemmatimonadetes bacterium]|nr:hypothetical protein [Gemmatimonadota bacterium]
DEVGFSGPRLTICTACSSSTGAIGIARDLLLTGRADLVLCGGADVLTERVFAGFHALGVLSGAPCAPFSTPFGTTLGEGAGFLVLERAEGARARAAEVLAWLSGYGLSGDGYHETSPDPGGHGVSRAIRAALADAGLDATEIGYVNAHGSGTEANDSSEWTGIRRTLPKASAAVVSSCKGAFGHAQGAAGALETIATILLMRRGLAPATLNFNGPRPFAPDDPVTGPRPRPHAYDHAVNVNSGFGGANAAVVVSRCSPRVVSSRSRTPVAVVGLGLLSRHGVGVDRWVGGLDDHPGGKVPYFSFDGIDPRIDPHGLDLSSRLLTAAAALGLRDAELRLTRGTREEVGLVMGATRPSPESVRAYGESVVNHGLARASAPAFARIVLNAPAGFCSKLLQLRGPLSAVTTGFGSGLASILLAADLVQRPDVTVMLGAAIDELEAEETAASSPGEGSSCVVLAKLGSWAEIRSAPRLVSWAWAGGRCLEEAVGQALADVPMSRSDLDAVFDEGQYAGEGGRESARALPSALAFIDAILALRRGDVRSAMVTSDLGRSASMAAVLRT